MQIYEAYEDVKILVASFGDLDVERADILPTDGASADEDLNDSKIKESKEIKVRVDGVPISEEEFLDKISKIYSQYEPIDIYQHMEFNFRYSSFWVFSEITSAAEYVDYITNKAKTLKENGQMMKIKMMHIKDSGKPCLVLEQKGDDDPACLMVETSNNGLISRMDMMPISFYILV